MVGLGRFAFPGQNGSRGDARDILRYFLIGLILVGLGDVSNRMGPFFPLAQLILGGLLVTSFFVGPRKGILILLLLAVSGRDIVGGDITGEIDHSYATASIWQFNFGPLRPSWIMFLCIFIQLARLSKLYATPLMKAGILWFATVPIITGLVYGGFFGPHSQWEVVVDVKFGAMLLGSMILFLSVLRTGRGLTVGYLLAFTGVLLARHAVDLVYYFFNVGPALIEGVSRVSEDTAKGGIVFLIFLGITQVLLHRRYFFGLALGMVSILLLVVYATRLLWITFLVGLLLLPLFTGIRKSVAMIVVLVLLCVAGLGLFYVVSPRTAEVVLVRSATITAGREIEKFAVAVPYNVLSRIDPIRYGEGMNILDASQKRFFYLWGTGYGGYYHDDAVTFPPTLSSSYQWHSLNSGMFYTAHLFSLQVFLKHGLVGLILIFLLWAIPGFSLFRRMRRDRKEPGRTSVLLEGLMLCLICFLPTAISQLYWSGKGLFLNGALLALCIELGRRADEADSPEDPACSVDLEASHA